MSDAPAGLPGPGARAPRPRVEFVACHRLPERSLFWRGRQLPVCARCTGILAGYAAFPLFAFGVVAAPLWLSLALQVPTLVDGVTQAAGWRTSRNALRLATGLLAGVGQAGVMAWTGTALALLIRPLLLGG